MVEGGSSRREMRTGNGGMVLTKLHIDMHENVRMETIILFIYKKRKNYYLPK